MNHPTTSKTTHNHKNKNYTLQNKLGTTLTLNPYGARITRLSLPDNQGLIQDIVLGFPTTDEYIRARNEPYFGCTVGRYANRISKGIFTLNGTTYHLATNDGTNHLHGGRTGFDKVVWTVVQVNEDKNGWLWFFWFYDKNVLFLE